MKYQNYLKQEKSFIIKVNKWTCKKKFCTGILISIGVILLISIILTLIIGKKYSKLYLDSGYEESWNDLYGNKTINIPYFNNNKIINTFKKNSVNYKVKIGEIDYDSWKRGNKNQMNHLYPR